MFTTEKLQSCKMAQRAESDMAGDVACNWLQSEAWPKFNASFLLRVFSSHILPLIFEQFLSNSWGSDPERGISQLLQQSKQPFLFASCPTEAGGASEETCRPLRSIRSETAAFVPRECSACSLSDPVGHPTADIFWLALSLLQPF